MSRRVSMPAADELFRPTVVRDTASPDEGDQDDEAVPDAQAGTAGPRGEQDVSDKPGPSGRVRHDEKMTVYVTADELLDIEHARLMLRRLGIGVDRGRLVREAVSLVLADLEQHGDDSVIVQRLLQA